jgi:hypothetical protein
VKTGSFFEAGPRAPERDQPDTEVVSVVVSRHQLVCIDYRLRLRLPGSFRFIANRILPTFRLPTPRPLLSPRWAHAPEVCPIKGMVILSCGLTPFGGWDCSARADESNSGACHVCGVPSVLQHYARVSPTPRGKHSVFQHYTFFCGETDSAGTGHGCGGRFPLRGGGVQQHLVLRANPVSVYRKPPFGSAPGK